MDTSRLQLALNVNEIDEAIAFYSKLFDATPHKRRDGYANFAIANPPLKLVLIENPDANGGLNHLGVEVADTGTVQEAAERFTLQQMETVSEEAVDCCYAVQDKVWVTSPEGEQWEVYTVLDEEGKVGATSTSPSTAEGTTTSACCSTSQTSEAVACC